jgi:hypothetical protein
MNIKISTVACQETDLNAQDLNSTYTPGASPDQKTDGAEEFENV